MYADKEFSQNHSHAEESGTFLIVSDVRKSYLPHFGYNRQELRNKIKVMHITNST